MVGGLPLSRLGQWKRASKKDRGDYLGKASAIVRATTALEKGKGK